MQEGTDVRHDARPGNGGHGWDSFQEHGESLIELESAGPTELLEQDQQGPSEENSGDYEPAEEDPSHSTDYFSADDGENRDIVNEVPRSRYGRPLKRNPRYVSLLRGGVFSIFPEPRLMSENPISYREALESEVREEWSVGCNASRIEAH